jgi:hypothetical protein
MIERLYTAEEVKNILKCSLTFVYEHQEELGVIRIGKLMRFPESKLRGILNVRMETRETMAVEVSMEGRGGTGPERIRYTKRGKTRPSRKESSPVEDPGDPFGLRRSVRTALERFAVPQGKILPIR